MFDLRKEVPSLELCKRLKELGYPQERAGWHWVLTKENDKEQWALKYYCTYEDIPYWAIHIKAPTYRELGKWFSWLLQNNCVECKDKETENV